MTFLPWQTLCTLMTGPAGLCSFNFNYKAGCKETWCWRTAVELDKVFYRCIIIFRCRQAQRWCRALKPAQVLADPCFCTQESTLRERLNHINVIFLRLRNRAQECRWKGPVCPVESTCACLIFLLRVYSRIMWGMKCHHRHAMMGSTPKSLKTLGVQHKHLLQSS